MFHACATAVIDFAIETVGVRRLEARAAAANARGNGALCKLGASPEGVLQNSFIKNGRYHDQLLWAISTPNGARAARWKRRTEGKRQKAKKRQKANAKREGPGAVIGLGHPAADKA